MKKIFFLLCLSFMDMISSAQTDPQRKGFLSDFPQQHFFAVSYGFLSVDDDLGIIDDQYCMTLGFTLDNYFNDTFFVGGGLALVMPHVSSRISMGVGQSYYSYTDFYNLDIPVYGGFNIGGNLFRIETGPSFGFALAGETEVRQNGDIISTTKLKDMEDVSKFYVSWMVNAYILRFLKVGFGVALTDTPFGEDTGVSCLSIGLAF